MALYNYRARNSQDESASGLVEADSENIAADILQERGFRVLYLEEKKQGLASLQISFSRVKAKDLVIFSRQLSILISAGVPLTESLKDVSGQTKSDKLKKALFKVAAEVEGGSKFSEALESQPKVFDSFFVNIVKSGELSGRLQEVLLYLADQLEKDYDLRGKIRGAMIYPAFVMSSLFVIGILMMIFVVPKLTEMLAQTGAALPWSTRLVMGTSKFLVVYWWLVALAAVASIGAFRLAVRQPAGRRFVDNVKLRLPIFGKLFNYIAVIRFCRSMHTLMAGGVDIVGGLGIVADMMGNEVYRDLVVRTKETVASGGALAEVLDESKLVPKMLPQMLKTGEATGRVDEVLEKISEFYRREVDNIIANLMSLLEPVIMVILGVAVAVMIMAIILPMYAISSNM